MSLDQRVVDLYRAGESWASIQAGTGLSLNRIAVILNTADVPRRGRCAPPAKKDLDIDRIAAMRSNGASVTAIAREFQVSRETIRRRLRESASEPSGEPREPNDSQQIRAQYERGTSLHDLAARTGLTVPAVRAAVEAAGGKIRSRGRPVQVKARTDGPGTTPAEFLDALETSDDLVPFPELFQAFRDATRIEIHGKSFARAVRKAARRRGLVLVERADGPAVSLRIGTPVSEPAVREVVQERPSVDFETAVAIVLRFPPEVVAEAYRRRSAARSLAESLGYD